MIESVENNTQVCNPGDEGSVTVSISRRVKPGHETDYEQWVSGVIDAASSYPGHLGTNVLRPSSTTNYEYVIIYRFDSYANCQTWEQSDLRKTWLDKLEGLVEGEATTQRGTGLEFWFDLPELPVSKPAPHKMALVLIVVVYVLVLGLNIIFAPILEPMPLWLRILCIVVAQVLLMTYLVMPKVTLMLKDWLYKN